MFPSKEDRVKKTKLFAIIAGTLVLVLALVIGLLSLFRIPIPIWSKYRAKTKIERYIGKSLNEDIGYNFKNESFVTEVDSNSISYKPSDDTIYDEQRNRSYDLEARRRYEKFDTKPFPGVKFPDTVVVSTEIPAKKPDEIRQEIATATIVEDKSFANEDEVKKRAADIIVKIINHLGDDFNITKTELYYECKNGWYSLNIDDPKITKTVTKEDLMKVFKKKK